MASKGCVVVCAGGTGGHLFPAEALAGELTRRGYDVHLATDDRARRFVQTFSADHIHVIPSATLSSKNPFKLIRTFWQLLKGVRSSRRLFKTLNPKLVAGFGGYPTLPPLYAASGAKIPTLIHEQNGVMGRANKALASRVNAIAGGFLTDDSAFTEKMVITGNPVRPAIVAASKRDYQPALENKPFHLLVFGGSQGASFFNEVVPEALQLLDKDLQQRLHLVQQARDDVKALQDEYHAIGIKAEIAPFFIDMAERIAASHFVIARSGASTVAEIAAIGRPALLVPYPYALDHDQAANAATLAASGGVKVVNQSELDAQKLVDIIRAAMTSPDLLVTQAKAAKSVGHIDAAEKLANVAESLITGQSLQK